MQGTLVFRKPLPVFIDLHKAARACCPCERSHWGSCLLGFHPLNSIGLWLIVSTSVPKMAASSKPPLFAGSTGWQKGWSIGNLCIAPSRLGLCHLV